MARGVGLSRARVIDLARGIADSEGAGALNLSALALAAGVRKPSLYKHVDGLPDLRAAITLQTYREMSAVLSTAIQGEATAPDRVIAVAHGWRDYARRCPGSYVIASRTHLRGNAEVFEAGAQLMSVVLGMLADLGVPVGDRVHAARAFRALIHGFVLLEVSEGFGLDVNLDLSFEQAIDGMVRGWTTARTPPNPD